MDIAKDQVRALRTRKAKWDGEDEGRGQGEDVTLIDIQRHVVAKMFPSIVAIVH
jgi:hypothetical protein